MEYKKIFHVISRRKKTWHNNRDNYSINVIHAQYEHSLEFIILVNGYHTNFTEYGASKKIRKFIIHFNSIEKEDSFEEIDD